MLTDEGEPESFDETLQLEDTTKWEQVIDDEMSWMSNLHNCVALSSTEAKYMAIIETKKEMIWITKYLRIRQEAREKIFCTVSQSVIPLVKNLVYHSKTKYIRRRYHFTRRLVEEGDMCLEKIEGAKNPTDILTRCVDVGKLRLCKVLIGMV